MCSRSATARPAPAPAIRSRSRRARNPRIANLRKAQLTNEYWLTDLDNAMSDPRKLDLIRTTFSDYEKLTTADLQAAARAWFRDETAWRMVVRAKP